MKEEFRLDLDRRRRLGMIEAIWGEHKTADQIASIMRNMDDLGELAFVTRVNQLKAFDLLATFEKPVFHAEAQCLTLGSPINTKQTFGQVLVLAGGTSDLLVASEAELALRFHGVKAEVMLDVGVAGLHRLLNNLEKIKRFDVVIACAGMEGALPTVLAGLIPQPVIGVPVSVGYGVSSGGKAALNGMLASCAPGLTVVNIDNGYGAAMAAFRILQSLNIKKKSLLL